MVADATHTFFFSGTTDATYLSSTEALLPPNDNVMWRCCHSRNNRTADAQQMPGLFDPLTRRTLQAWSLFNRSNMVAVKYCFPKTEMGPWPRKCSDYQVFDYRKKCVLEMWTWWRAPVLSIRTEATDNISAHWLPFSPLYETFQNITGNRSWRWYTASTITDVLFILRTFRPIESWPKNRKKKWRKWRMRESNRLQSCQRKGWPKRTPSQTCALCTAHDQLSKQPTRGESSAKPLFDDLRESEYVQHIEANEGGNTTGLYFECIIMCHVTCKGVNIATHLKLNGNRYHHTP